MSQDATKAGSAWNWWAEARILRWSLLFVLAVAAVVLSFVDGALEICEEQLVQGSREVVEVCRHPDVGDPGVLAFMLVFLVVLWPDVSQVSFGVVSLTRKVEEQSAKTEEVRRDVQMLGVSLNQALSQQVSQQVVNYIGTTATAEPRAVVAQPPPRAGVTMEEVLEAIRDQPAYRQAAIPDAWKELDGVPQGPVRVAIIGAGIDPALRDVEGLGPHLEDPYTVGGASTGAVGATGHGSVGHVLAIAPTATVRSISVLGASYQLASPTALHAGIAAALAWNPDVLLIGLGGPAVEPVDELLAEQSGKVALVAPAGNDGASTSSWPGIVSGVMSVAASDQAGKRAPFSNYGTGVDLCAPGDAVTSLVGVAPSGELEFGKVSGTSVAADIVAGVAALLVATGRVQGGGVLGIFRRAAMRSTSEGLALLDAGAAVKALPTAP
jgi:subtilisin family serine protease